MAFFFGTNPLVDSLLKRYILEVEPFVYSSPSSVKDTDVDKIIISVNKDSWPLPDDVMHILGSKRTYIFFDLHDVEDGFEVMTPVFPSDEGKTGVTMFQFRSLSGIMQNACDKGLIPILGTPYCDVHLFFRDMKKLFAMKPGTYHLMTGEIPKVDILKQYFSRNEIREYYETKEVKEVILKSDIQLFSPKKVNIYIPTYHRTEKAKKCILSLIEGVKTSKHEFRIYIGDNNTGKSEMIDFLGSLVETGFVCVNLYRENKGKARAVNDMHRQAKMDREGVDYVFSIDSDMVMIPSSKRIHTTWCNTGGNHQLDGMIELLERGHNLGVVSSFQTGQSEHWFGRGVEGKRERGYNIGESKTGVGIAGGCICMRADDWDLIGGYEESYDIYTADDAIIMDKVDKILKKRAIIGMDFPFYHPPSSEDDPGYVKWKKERFQKDGLKFGENGYKKKEYGKGYYDV